MVAENLAILRRGNSEELISACFMWCKLVGETPINTDGMEGTFVKLAVADYSRNFADLNTAQRRIIAGLAK